jgi:hypothetical protein
LKAPEPYVIRTRCSCMAFSESFDFAATNV